jgi:hypothetical protein
VNEADWQDSTDPQAMLDRLRGRASERKLRLFVGACCRRIGDALPPEGRAAVAVAERLADGLASEPPLRPCSAGMPVMLLRCGREAKGNRGRRSRPPPEGDQGHPVP